MREANIDKNKERNRPISNLGRNFNTPSWVIDRIGRYKSL